MTNSEVKWIAYYRDEYRTRIRREDERAPKYFQSRPATPAEIRREIKRRARDQEERLVMEQFKARQDYKDAKAIASILEWITPDRHCLDKLTPEEWADLIRRLGK